MNGPCLYNLSRYMRGVCISAPTPVLCSWRLRGESELPPQPLTWHQLEGLEDTSLPASMLSVEISEVSSGRQHPHLPK